MTRTYLVLFAAAVASLATISASAAGPNPKAHHTEADNTLATKVLLQRSDLAGAGWKSSRASTSTPTCGITIDLQPNESDLVETGLAHSSLFTNNRYQAVTESARVFETPQQANAAWRRTVTKALLICMEQQVEGNSSMMSAVSVTDWQRIPLPATVQHTAGFRVVATANTGGPKKSKVYFDLILLGQSRTFARVSLSSLNKPLAPAFERHLVESLSRRLNS